MRSGLLRWNFASMDFFSIPEIAFLLARILWLKKFA